MMHRLGSRRPLHPSRPPSPAPNPPVVGGPASGRKPAPANVIASRAGHESDARAGLQTGYAQLSRQWPTWPRMIGVHG